MDRRSWFWRRNPSDKSSGETDSFGSGSLSSPSEMFSDEQQVYPIQNAQSPEAISFHAENKHDDRVKILREKLSAAVAAINEKEELVKQHAKVAEEAVHGWEMAEDEMNALKQQLDAATTKNSTLEDEIVHLDGALKECLRQLRQVREEQDQRIQEGIGKQPEITETTGSDLQEKLADISAQLEIANAKSVNAEKENASLQLEIHSLSDELRLVTLERDLSIKRAENTSKQHLENIRRVAKLEAECRGLKATARKGTSFNDRLKAETSSSKRDMTSLSRVGFMDDFIEMEKLAAVPVQEKINTSLGYVPSIDKSNESGNDNTVLKAKLEAMINRTAELEEKIEMAEAEKVELGSTLSRCQERLQLSESRARKLQAQFNECQNELEMCQVQLKAANKKMGILLGELDLAGELRQAIDLELDDANVRREASEGQLKALENENKKIRSEVSLLEDKLCRMENDAESWQNQLVSMKQSEEVERELEGIVRKKESVESELKAVQAEVKSLLTKISSLENEGEKERRLTAEFDANFKKIQSKLSRTKNEAEMWKSQLSSVNDLKEGVARELQMMKTNKEEVDRQLETVQSEAKSLLARVSLLESEMDKERKMSAEFEAKCRKLEDELWKTKSEAGIRFLPLSEELNKQQEKEMAMAASKLAECQKTIASFRNQLKSLATLDDLFLDSDNQLDISDKESLLLKTDMQPATSHSSNLHTVVSDSVSSETVTRNSFTVTKKAKEKEVLSSLVVDKSLKNGYGKFFTRFQGAQLEPETRDDDLV